MNQPRTDGLPAPRLTPYEFVFGDPLFSDRLFPEIRDEAGLSGQNVDAPDRFRLLTSVGKLVQQLAPDHVSPEAGHTTEQSRELAHLLYQAWQFWRFGRELILLDEPLARSLASHPPTIGGWELTPPGPSGYLQLPRNLFWSRLSEDATPEPVDGFFWAMIGTEDPKVPPFERIDLLLVLGLRAGRPGFGVIDVGAELGAGPGHWGDVDARPTGEDFSNFLPGGELETLHGLLSPAEALKLASLCFWRVAVDPRSLTERAVVERPGASGLAFRLLREAPSDG